MFYGGDRGEFGLAGHAVGSRIAQVDPNPKEPGLSGHWSVLAEGEVERDGAGLPVYVREIRFPVFGHQKAEFYRLLLFVSSAKSGTRLDLRPTPGSALGAPSLRQLGTIPD